jgi:DNA mismatch endonuclease, patch repair protein
MSDVFSPTERSRVMAAVRSRGNKATELHVVAIFREHKINGWRRHQPLPGRPDFVFYSARVAVFVDGCFWHGCVRHCRMPAGNREYWRRKLQRNSTRDRLTNRKLRAAGWSVVRIWEHALSKPDRVAQRVAQVLARKRPLTRRPAV